MRIVLAILAGLSCCGPLVQSANEALAERTYEADNDQCRKDHPPRSRELHDCYTRVDAKWHITHAVHDGGAR